MGTINWERFQSFEKVARGIAHTLGVKNLEYEMLSGKLIDLFVKIEESFNSDFEIPYSYYSRVCTRRYFKKYLFKAWYSNLSSLERKEHGFNTKYRKSALEHYSAKYFSLDYVDKSIQSYYYDYEDTLSIRHTFQKIESKHKKLLKLKYEYGLTDREISKVLNKNVSNQAINLAVQKARREFIEAYNRQTSRRSSVQAI